MNSGRRLRIVAAIAILIGGLIHLQLYFKGYRSIETIGRAFLLNAISSGVVAALLVSRKEWFVRLAGIGLAAGTIGAFIVSRQGDGLFDFREHGLKPSPQAIIALLVEIAASVALLVTFLPSAADHDEPAPMLRLAVSVATCAVVLLGLGAYWACHYHTTTKTIANQVTIVDFAFAPPDLTVSKGTTVVWTNGDAVDHSIVAEDNSFGTDSIAPSSAYQFTFASDGTFIYHCGIHPSMTGTISVTG